MSYRNPRQVVDTQTSQHYANLQKTIAGSFDNYTKSVQIADAKLQKQNEIKAKAERERRNKIIEESSEVSKDIAGIDSEYPTIEIAPAAKKMINDNGKAKRANPKYSPELIAQNQSVENLAETAYGASKLQVAQRETYYNAKGYPVGTMGGLTSWFQSEDVEAAFNSTPEGLKARTIMNFNYNGSNNIVPTYTTTHKNGKSFTYSPGKLNIPVIIDIQPSIKDINKQSVENKNYNFNDPSNLIYKKGKKLKDDDGKVIGVFPNRDTYEKNINQAVKANLINGESAFDAINLYNDVLRRHAKPEDGKMPTEIPRIKEWKEYAKDDQSPEAIQQGKYQKKIVDAATVFTANQSGVLNEPYMYKFSDVPEKDSDDEQAEEGMDLYNKMKQNPVGLYQEYNKAAPGYDREAGTITIYAKDVEGDDAENIVYDMENAAERNEFYLYLLKSSGRNKGSSAASKEFQKDFEEAMRSDTRNRSKEIKQEKKINKQNQKKFGLWSSDNSETVTKEKEDPLNPNS
jgi:hypothetical protein